MQETLTKDGSQMPRIVLDSRTLAEHGVKGGDLGRGRAGRTLSGGLEVVERRGVSEG